MRSRVPRIALSHFSHLLHYAITPFPKATRRTSPSTIWRQPSRTPCTKPSWNVITTYHTAYDALLLQRAPRSLPTCHTLITSTNGTVTALPPTSVSMTTATKTAWTRSEACFCHPETFCFLSCSPEDASRLATLSADGVLWSATGLFGLILWDPC